MSADIIQTLSEQLTTRLRLSWSHYVFLVKIEDSDERSCFEIESINAAWSIRDLERQFNTGLYERLALSRDKAGIRKLAQEGQVVAHPTDLIKGPYVLEFLGLNEEVKYSETNLETAIINGELVLLSEEMPEPEDLVWAALTEPGTEVEVPHVRCAPVALDLTVDEIMEGLGYGEA